ncbi:MAG TPA: response regulator [Phycisphaerae bacterium]|nr:response regulator [Phycisphaerae bacterium]
MPRLLAVLIVEDCEDDALLIVRELKRGGYEVVFERVDTAAAMQTALSQRNWDIIIADYAMPHFSGLAALKLLKECRQDLPFIIVSGAIGEDVAVEAMRLGAHDYLIKGKLARLVPAVERELRDAEERHQRRRAQEELRAAHAELEKRVAERTAELAQANEKLREEIAERQRIAEELKVANQAKDRFLAVLSHELRTPLTPVLLTASLLERRGDLPPDVIEDVRTIRNETELEARIIDDLLDLTRVARGKMKFEFRRLDIHQLARRAVDSCAAYEGVKIEMELTAEQPMVVADSVRLQQVFINLFNNARKFTRADGLITVRSFNPQPGEIRIEVTDTGAGFRPELRERMFLPFEQGDDAVRPYPGGLGLGLAICKAIVEEHHGRIDAFSAGPGRGATVAFNIPTLAPHAAADPADPRDGQRWHAGALRSLLVEDHRPTLDAMTKLLDGAGHEVQTASTLATALEVGSRQRFDLVISDLRLPDGGGDELMRALSRRYGVTGIAVSGCGMEEDIRRSHDAGFVEHLTKPIDFGNLEAAIQRARSFIPAG